MGGGFYAPPSERLPDILRHAKQRENFEGILFMVVDKVKSKLRIGLSRVRMKLKTAIRPGGDNDNARSQGRPPRLYAFGSSSTEVFDYIFGPTKRYCSFWAGGWSARGLRKSENREYVLQCLQNAKPKVIIFLHFGVADAVFNAAHRMEKGDFMDPEGFCQEAAQGVKMLVDDLRKAGFHNIYAMGVGAPCRLPSTYFRRRFKMHGSPTRYQAQLLGRINELVGEVCEMRDLTPVLGDEYGRLKAEFHRPWHGHHADYTKTQKLIWEGICDIPGLPPHRETWHEVLYKHKPRGNITKQVLRAKYRPANLARIEAEGPVSRLVKKHPDDKPPLPKPLQKNNAEAV